MTFGRNVRVGIGAPEGDVFLCRHTRRREPQGMFYPAILAEHGILSHEAIVHRRGAQRSRCFKLLVRKADSEAPRIIFSHLGVSVGARCPSAVACDIHAPYICAWITIDHPLRERKSHSAALAKACHHAACYPEVLQP